MRTFNLDDKKALTLENIERLVSDQQIYEFYLGDEVNFNHKIKSPFRDDQSPSFSFLLTINNRILWRDWGDGPRDGSSNVITFVMDLKNIPFLEAVELINKDMKLGLGGVDPEDSPFEQDIPEKRDVRSSLVNPKEKLIEIETQPYTKEDLAYWAQYGISSKALLYFGIHSAKYVWIDGVLVRRYSRSNPVFAYDLEKYGYDVHLWKIYQPMNPYGKWLSNAPGHVLQGLSQLEWNANVPLIITKSLKDVVVLYLLGYDSVAVQSEGSTITGTIAGSFLNNYSDVIIFFDNDDTGIKGAKKLCLLYDEFLNISLPKAYGCKDISDYVKDHSFGEAKRLVDYMVQLVTSDEGLPY